MHSGIAVDPIHQCLKLSCDLDAEQTMRTTIYPDDEHPPVVLDHQIASYLLCQRHHSLLYISRSQTSPIEWSERLRSTTSARVRVGKMFSLRLAR